MKMSDKAYDRWKYVAQIALPAVGTLYFALTEIWGLPFGKEIVGSITAVDTCLGTLLHLARVKYGKDDEEGQ